MAQLEFGLTRRVFFILQLALLGFAFALWVNALFLPAWPGLGGPAFIGLHCLIFGCWWWPSNALLWLSPLVVCGLPFLRGKAGQAFYASIYLVSMGVVGWAGCRGWNYPGCFQWTCAHALVTVAILLPTGRRRTPQPARGSTRRSGQARRWNGAAAGQATRPPDALPDRALSPLARRFGGGEK